MDRRVDRQTDRRADGQTGGWTDIHTEIASSACWCWLKIYLYNVLGVAFFWPEPIYPLQENKNIENSENVKQKCENFALVAAAFDQT